MPAPMKPLPITPIRRTGRARPMPAGTPSSFLSAVVAKKISTSLRETSRHREFPERLRLGVESLRHPIAERGAYNLDGRNGRRIVPASLLLDLFPCLAGTRPSCPGDCHRAMHLRDHAAARLGFQPRASRSAAATAVSSRMASGTSSSTRPIWNAFLARSLLPARMMSNAARTPINRGSRFEPPAPGISPSCVSGSPSCVLG